MKMEQVEIKHNMPRIEINGPNTLIEFFQLNGSMFETRVGKVNEKINQMNSLMLEHFFF